MDTDITITTTTALSNPDDKLPALSPAASFKEDYGCIEGDEHGFGGVYRQLFYTGRVDEDKLVQRLQQQYEFLTGDYYNQQLMPRLDKFIQPATEKQVVAFVLNVLAGRTKAGKDEKEAFMHQLSGM